MSDQALLEGYLRSPGGTAYLDWSYRAGRSQEASRRKIYMYTGSGRGSYRWEDENGDGVQNPEEFIPDEHGSYYLYEETLDDYKPVNVVHLFGRLGLDIPTGRFFKIKNDGLLVRSETSIELNEKSTASAKDVFLLKLNHFRKTGLSTSGDARVQEDITIPLSGGDGSVRLRFFYLDSYNAEFVQGAERTGTIEQSMRLRHPLSEKAHTEININHSIFKRTMEQRETGNFKVYSLTGSAGVSYYHTALFSVSVSAGGGAEREKMMGVESRLYSLKPTATYRFSGRGKIEAAYELISVALENTHPGVSIPYTMARGGKEGNNHDISITCDYRLSRHIEIVATYTGRQFADREFENYAQSQIRALF
jgi:hypothetical protein